MLYRGAPAARMRDPVDPRPAARADPPRCRRSRPRRPGSPPASRYTEMSTGNPFAPGMPCTRVSFALPGPMPLRVLSPGCRAAAAPPCRPTAPSTATITARRAVLSVAHGRPSLWLDDANGASRRRCATVRAAAGTRGSLEVARCIGSSGSARAVDALEPQQQLLAAQAPRVAAERAPRPQHAVARHHDRDRVRAEGGADRARGLRVADRGRRARRRSSCGRTARARSPRAPRARTVRSAGGRAAARTACARPRSTRPARGAPRRRRPDAPGSAARARGRAARAARRGPRPRRPRRPGRGA